MKVPRVKGVKMNENLRDITIPKNSLLEADILNKIRHEYQKLIKNKELSSLDMVENFLDNYQVKLNQKSKYLGVQN